MKILIVINDYLNKSNGMCISTQRFVRAFRQMGHEVRVISNNRYGDPDYPLGVQTFPLLSGVIEKEGYTFAKVDPQMIRKAVEWADIVHLEDPFFVCRRASIEAKRMGKPVTGAFHIYPENMTYALHIGYSRLINGILMRLFLSGVFDRCERIHCPSKEVRDCLSKYYDPKKLKVISNGIDGFFLNRGRLRSPDGTLRILSVGRYAVEKNHKLLIRAVAQSKYRDSIRLTIAGQGPLDKALRSLAEKLDVPVVFGFMDHEHVRRAMLESDLYVHCADVEIEGMSCMEAFACGCVPVISDAKLSSTRSFALHDENLFRHGNARELAKKIDFFFEHPDTLRRMSGEYMAYGATMSVERSAEKLIEMMDEAYQERKK